MGAGKQGRKMWKGEWVEEKVKTKTEGEKKRIGKSGWGGRREERSTRKSVRGNCEGKKVEWEGKGDYVEKEMRVRKKRVTAERKEGNVEGKKGEREGELSGIG